jgi:hypothetical protein
LKNFIIFFKTFKNKKLTKIKKRILPKKNLFSTHWNMFRMKDEMSEWDGRIIPFTTRKKTISTCLCLFYQEKVPPLMCVHALLQCSFFETSRGGNFGKY